MVLRGVHVQCREEHIDEVLFLGVKLVDIIGNILMSFKGNPVSVSALSDQADLENLL